jgi:Protein of unknown function (DUF1549)/Protein of unknown function (DUF1553)/Planctomycete cytochrome C
MPSTYLTPSIVLGLVSVANWVTAAEPIDFAHDIVPILRQHCGQCHTGDKKKGGYSLNTRASLIAGGESGPAVVTGKSDQSELVRRVLSRDKDEMMPPEGERLSDKDVASLKRWIDGGLAWEDGFAFRGSAYEPPLKPRRVTLPPVVAGRDHPIDRIVDAYFLAHKIERPAAVDDTQFVRRASLDLIGLLPAPERVASFVAEKRARKRDEIVREFLSDDVAYAENWLTFWNDLLRNDYTGTGFITGGRKQITGWLYRSLVDNKPFDVLVRELIAPSADSEGFIQGIRWRGTVSASQSQEVQFAQNISQAFLGINMKCASCHDSFIDHWKLSEAYGLAAIYSTQPLAIHRCDKPTGTTAQSAWIFPELGQIDAAAPQPERLKQLAALMTHPENGRFTRTIVNRLWHRLMGRGIVHPVDAMHTEPWSADLLDFLAVDFAEHGYDLKHTLALICTSDIYQARTPPVADEPDREDYVFQGPLARRMTAEQFIDAVWQLTGDAPAKNDAQVIRAKLKSADGNAATAPPLTAAWIWSSADAAQAPAGQTATFRRQFKLPAAPAQAIAVITCDNEYRLLVNGREVAADDNWETVEVVALEPQLKAGSNEILIVAKNAGRQPNAAGLVFEARIKGNDNSALTIATNADWQWTAAQPDARGRFQQQPTDWKSAVEIKPAAVWASRVGESLPLMLHQAAAGPIRMVRASLVKSDALMRSLGRPNRDQIVTMRPSELTTLEAIDLANGPILAEAIEHGAKQWLPAADQATADIVDRLYAAALSRPPTADERTTATAMLGPRPTSESIQDLMWAIFMLPEFQLVR